MNFAKALDNMFGTSFDGKKNELKTKKEIKYYSNYINGGFLASNGSHSSHMDDIFFQDINPSNEEFIGYFPKSGQDVVELAVYSAAKAKDQWSKLSRIQRGEYFYKLSKIVEERSEELAEAITLDTGKTINESRAEVVETLHMFQYCFAKSKMPSGEILDSEIPEKDVYVFKKPKGIVAVISPWNFPLAINAAWNSGPALLEGNTVVAKPSEDSPYVGNLIAEIYHQAGFPHGVFNLIHGDGETGRMLVEHRLINHICFTGSFEVGQKIRQHCATTDDKTCSCETGSKSAVVVFGDANLEMSVNACLQSAFKLSGQRCVSAGRILIQRNIYDAFCKRFVELKDSVQFGPLINDAQLNRVCEYNLKTEEDEHCKVLVSGECFHKAGTRCSGFWIHPHIYACEWADKPYLKEEVFGPHVALIPFDDVDHAIKIYNDTKFGLSLSVCTNDYRIMRKMRQECDFGLGYVNLPGIGAESHLPFAGTKCSGYGWGSAAATFDAVVYKHTWTINHADNSFKMAQGLK